MVDNLATILLSYIPTAESRVLAVLIILSRVFLSWAETLPARQTTTKNLADATTELSRVCSDEADPPQVRSTVPAEVMVHSCLLLLSQQGEKYLLLEGVQHSLQSYRD